jgi:hypothetical protein
MALSSVYESILSAAAGVVTDLVLTFNPPGGGNPVTPQAVVLKAPKVQESLDTPLPVIAVSPAVEQQRTEPAATEGLVFVTYPVEIAIHAAGNRDFAADLDVWLNWREQIRRQFQGTSLAGVQQVIDVNTDADPAFDRAAIPDNYDRSKLTIRFKTIEPRGL